MLLVFSLDDLLLMNTPPNRRAQQSKLAAIKETQDKDTTSLSGVDKLLTFSPIATVCISNIPLIFIHFFLFE
jgi:hypothetical protein